MFFLPYSIVSVFINLFASLYTQPAQKRFKNVALTLIFTLFERFWNVIFGKFI